METKAPIYQTKIRQIDLRGVLYLALPSAFLGGLVGWLLFIMTYKLVPILAAAGHVGLAKLLLLTLFLIGIGFLGLGGYCFSYVPRRVLVYEDGLLFIMFLGKRRVPVWKIISCEPVTVKAALGSAVTLKSYYMTNSAQGIVLLKKRPGLGWVFTPQNPEEFVAAVNSMLSEDRKKIGLAS